MLANTLFFLFFWFIEAEFLCVAPMKLIGMAVASVARSPDQIILLRIYYFCLSFLYPFICLLALNFISVFLIAFSVCWQSLSSMSIKRVLLKRLLLILGRAPHTAPPLLGSPAYSGPITASKRVGKSDYFNRAGNPQSQFPFMNKVWGGSEERRGFVSFINF